MVAVGVNVGVLVEVGSNVGVAVSVGKSVFVFVGGVIYVGSLVFDGFAASVFAFEGSIGSPEG